MKYNKEMQIQIQLKQLVITNPIKKPKYEYLLLTCLFINKVKLFIRKIYFITEHLNKIKRVQYFERIYHRRKSKIQ
ncbi:hypothetical protein TTHERM_001563108 (macronuclear) [Tetrahymena thermophila SB210]|uniref:Uncharacterized protein n=1 Tax=Tetrahymena thermophila (strain SB210) TaxID=312017 RepID=W7XLC8_TETTS|nr:hypothetical protein TTHERM_001563108 [Tetrahymena thermophila SB210]EWS76064.1 hypothetical protein TTHERM_001563108 [Tetrahymena thermophila SB210]|eukprot:XP_012651400.1 hypothetical protein TTHERM_001563108 [Tetrahymena thermophila SB210]